MTLTNELIIKRINHYLDKEGYRKERLAKRLGKSPSAFYAHLSGKHPKTSYQFAVELATILGLSPTFFIDEDYHDEDKQEFEVGLTTNIAFSAGELSAKGKEGLEQIGKLCDLVEIYK